MGKLTKAQLAQFLEPRLQKLHLDRISKLNKLSLKSILRRKNPYLFKANDVITAAEFISSVLNASISSSEETTFGGFLEELAIYICSEQMGGHKSGIKGIDLEIKQGEFVVFVESAGDGVAKDFETGFGIGLGGPAGARGACAGGATGCWGFRSGGGMAVAVAAVVVQGDRSIGTRALDRDIETTRASGVAVGMLAGAGGVEGLGEVQVSGFDQA